MHMMQGVLPRAALNAQLFRMNEGYRSAGISRYTYHLLRELPRAASDFELDVYSTAAQASQLFSNITLRTTRLPVHKPLARILWEQTLFAWNLFQKNYALLHSLAYVLPLLNATPSVVTVYDLSFIIYPEYFRPFQRLYLRLGTHTAIQRARRILTISESTKRDIVRLSQCDPAKIDVALPGVGSEFFQTLNATELEKFRRERGLPEHFILFLGTREPRKNIPSLLRAFALAKQKIKLPHSLVLAGGRGWMDEPITRVIVENNLESDVLFPGFVAEAELPYWFQAAECFVYPSQYEGFGMPPLEALASGTPVITSNVSSLPEAVGDAALLVDPKSSMEIADALVRVWTDKTLRQEMKARGVRHARQFTWTRTAQNTAQSYRLALGLPQPATAITQFP